MPKLNSTLIMISTFFALSAANAEEVEIYLIDMLDNKQSGYCLDIARAKGEKANPDDGLQGHTCYSPNGELMVDQIFDTDRFSDGVLYMPRFDVCAEISSPEAGSSIGLAKCNESAEQTFQFSGEGTITPEAASELCVTVAEDTRSGRSDVNQIKVLSLEACSEDNAIYQEWAVRSSL